MPINKLRGIAKRSVVSAGKNYEKLTNPKTCSLDSYTQIWVWTTLNKSFVLKTLTKVDFKKPPNDIYSKSLVAFSKELPFELIPPMHKKLFDAKPEDRKKVWKWFSLSFGKIEKLFINVAQARNTSIQNKGYSSQIDVIIKTRKIPLPKYNQFIKNADKIIDYCNSQLPKTKSSSEIKNRVFAKPCYICILPSFPFKNLEETFNFVANEYPILKKYKNKIVIKPDQKKTYVIYQPKKDIFEIKINKNFNIRHRSISLIHELSHVVDHLKDFKKEHNFLEDGKYPLERKAIEIQFPLLKKASPELYKAYYGEILLTLWNVLFQIELYTKPNQNLNKLYAETFNRCYKEKIQTSNPTYLIEEDIIMTPLASLQHAVAYTDKILSILKKGKHRGNISN